MATEWAIDSTSTIGGHAVTALGSPRVVDTAAGPAVEFSGEGDGLMLATNPAQGLGEFTAEVVFRPASDGPQEQRFFHMQENAEGNNRILCECCCSLVGAA